MGQVHEQNEDALDSEWRDMDKTYPSCKPLTIGKSLVIPPLD